MKRVRIVKLKVDVEYPSLISRLAHNFASHGDTGAVKNGFGAAYNVEVTVLRKAIAEAFLVDIIPKLIEINGNKRGIVVTEH